MNNYYVYMLASKKNGVIYTGITNDLIKRVYEHKNNLVKGFYAYTLASRQTGQQSLSFLLGMAVLGLTPLLW